jgi:protein-tyrosine phosphatase
MKWFAKKPAPELRVLLVCLGNICRSPTAEGVLRHKLAQAGLAERIELDSAGTGGWHIGEPPDGRAIRHALVRGYDLSALRGRRVSDEDFRRFHLMLAMDEDNLAELQRLRPEDASAELRLFAAAPVPDPYMGGPEGFDHVLDLVEAASEAWVREWAQRLERGTS